MNQIVTTSTQNEEQWKMVDSFPNYEVSSKGKVRNCHSGHIYKGVVRESGYIQVGLTKDNKHFSQNIHRLVALAFCQKDDDSNVVDHIDRNPSNNNYQNLRWTTTSGNARNNSLSEKNTSGTKGVSYKDDGYWIACWIDKERKRHQKYFSVKKYGFQYAKQMAINHRKEMALDNGYLNI